MPSVFNSAPTGLRRASAFDAPPADVAGLTPAQIEAAAAARSGQGAGAFEQGLSRGMRGLKSSVASLYGTGAEVMGAPAAAQDAYDYARQQQELGQLEAPGVKAWRDVHDPLDAARYAVSTAGSALPYVAPAVIAPAIARGLGARAGTQFATGAAANVLPMAGAEAERLREDPVTARLSSGQRLATSLGIGAGQAALYEAVPHIMGQRATGAAFAAKPSTSFLSNVAKDTAASSAGMGAAGAGNELMAQGVQTALNPDRDKSQDTDALMEAGVGGAVGMAPFAAPHAVMAHTVGAARAPVVDAVSKAGAAAKELAARTGDSASSAKEQLSNWLDSRKEQNSKDGDLLASSAKAPADVAPGPDAVDWLKKDDVQRHDAAARAAQHYSADENAPDYLRKAAADYLGSDKAGEAWAPLGAAVRKYKRETQFKSAVGTLKSGLQSIIGKTKDLASGVQEGFKRENAQAPFDPFDELLARQLFEHARVDKDGDNTEALISLAQALPALKTWMSNGYAGTKGGEVKIPPGLDRAFSDPIAALESAHTLMRKQGLLEEGDDARFKEAAKQLTDRQNARKDIGALVEDNLLPTAQAEHNFSGRDHQMIGEHIRAMLEHGELDEKGLDALFGPNKDKVLSAIEMTAKLKQGRNDSLDEKFGEEGQPAEGQGSSELKADVGWHGPYDMENEGAARGHKDKMGDVQSLGSEAKNVGLADHLREVHRDNPDEFMHQLTKRAEKHPAPEGVEQEKYLNDRFRMVRTEDASDKRSPIDIKGAEFGAKANSKNEWAMSAGKDNQYGEASNGRLWFERNIDGGKPFSTSAAKIMKRVRQGMKEEGDAGGEHSSGIVGQHDALMQGISSMLSAKHEDGTHALTGRVGYMRDGELHWMKDSDKLPEDLRLHDGTVKDVPAERTRLHNEKLAESMREWADKVEERGGREGDVKAVREALTKKDYKYLGDLQRKLVRDNWDDSKPRDAADAGETETSEMAAAANKKEATTARKFDEFTGEEIQPRASRDELSAAKEKLEASLPAQKQIDWTLDALRKGIPAFSEGIRKLSDEQRAGIKDVLTRMEAAKTADNPIWRGNPPKDMKSFGNRARVALDRLSAGKEEQKTTVKEEQKTTVKEAPKAGSTTEFETALKKEDFSFIDKPQDAMDFAGWARDEFDRMKGLERKEDETGEDNPSFDAEKYQQLYDYVNEAKKYLAGKTSTDFASFFDGMKGDHDAMGRQLAEILAGSARKENAAVPDSWARADRNKLEGEVNRLTTTVESDNENIASAERKGKTELARQLRNQYADMRDKLESAKQALAAYNAKANDESIAAKTADATTAMRETVIRAIQHMLGKDVSAAFVKELTGKSGAKISGDWEKGAIRIAMNAHDPLSVGFHESMHELTQRMLDDGHTKAAAVLQNMADSISVRRQMELAFAKEPAVLEAIKNDPAERVAYAFQLWAAGKLRVGPESQSVFQKIANVIRKVFGLLSNDQKARALMEQFAAGNMADRGAMARVLNTQEARGEYLRKVSKLVTPIMEKGSEYVGFAENKLTGSDNKALDWIGRALHNKTGMQGDTQGFISAKDQMHAKFDNMFSDALRGKSKDEIDAALEGLQKKEWHADPTVSKMQHDIADVFKKMYAYGEEVGLQRLDPATGKWVKMGKQDDYRLPVSWDASKLTQGGDKFKALMLEHHSDALQKIADQANAEVAAGKHAGEYTASWEKLNNKDSKPVTKEDVLNAIHNRMIRTNGQVEVRESQNELGFSPNMKAINARTLHFIDQKVFHEFQEKDMAKILTTYVSQMTHRAEYSRRFGPDGKVMQTKMDEAMKFESDRAMRENPKLSRGEADVEALEKLAPAQRAIMAIEGTLGHDISATLRKVNAYSIVYQNLRLLGYPLFSSIIDPLGIMVNGGEVKDAYATLKRGFSDVAKEWGHLTGLRKETVETRKTDRDEATRVAEMIGTIDSGMFMSTLGNTYGSQFLGATARGMNDKFFRWNGMEPFTRAMRIGATQAAISFIKRHYEAPNKHSERYFKELGLDRADVQITKEGGLNVDNRNVQQAVMRWVDGSILRPNAAIRPTMSSDPHYAMFYHLKQFMYATHAVITKRMMIELKNGNMDPTMLAFAGYIPVMLASDAAKGMLQGAMGGQTPVWEHEGVGGVVAHGLMRTGLTGPSQMGLDIPEYGVTSLFGPTVEQAVSATRDPLGDTIRKALAVGPFNFNMAGNAATE